MLPEAVSPMDLQSLPVSFWKHNMYLDSVRSHLHSGVCRIRSLKVWQGLIQNSSNHFQVRWYLSSPKLPLTIISSWWSAWARFSNELRTKLLWVLLQDQLFCQAQSPPRYPTKAKPFLAKPTPHMLNSSANLIAMMPDEMGIRKHSCQLLLAEPIFTLGSIQINSSLLYLFHREWQQWNKPPPALAMLFHRGGKTGHS